MSEVCRMYNSSAEFREFIQAKLKDGSLAKSNLLILVSAPSNGTESGENERALLDSFFGK